MRPGDPGHLLPGVSSPDCGPAEGGGGTAAERAVLRRRLWWKEGVRQKWWCASGWRVVGRLGPPGEPGAQGARDGLGLLGAGAAERLQREGGASIVPAAEVQPVTARRREQTGRVWGEDSEAPPHPTPASGRCTPAGWRGKGAPFLLLTANKGEK